MQTLVSLTLLLLPGLEAFGVPSCLRVSNAAGISRRVAIVAQELGQKPPNQGPDPNAMAAAQLIENMTEEQKIISKETYGLMLSTLLSTQENVASQISANYAMIDYAFLQRLDEAIDEGKPELVERLAEIKSAVNEEMATRMQAAAQAMKDLVTSPTPVVMEGKIAALARQGRLDDALLQLLEANLQQARAAGEAGKGAVQVLGRLQERVQTELDAKLPPETALLRRLLRMDDEMARQKLLREKMSPKKGSSGVLLSTVSKEEREDAQSTAPDVSPRDVARAIQEIKARFGNVDEEYDTGFVARLEAISEEAEAIALDLAGGKELSARQAQDLAWEQGSVSVWDLEAVEEQAHQDGNFAVWEEEAQEQMARQDSAMRKKAIDSDWGQQQ